MATEMYLTPAYVAVGLADLALAAHLDVAVVDAGTLVDLAELEEIERLQAFAFSAATFDIEGRKLGLLGFPWVPGMSVGADSPVLDCVRWSER